MHRGILICEEDFDVAAVTSAMRQRNPTSIGALVTFTGLVRDRNSATGDDSAVATLTLEHYPGMTEASIDKILDQAQARWPLLDLQVIHRVGCMAPAEQIVLVAVASAHREAAFAAAEFVMDYLKTKAVFWKKEHTQTGTHWVQSTQSDVQRAAHWQQPAKAK
jgi:molybdopterin synthase catalytic subunit